MAWTEYRKRGRGAALETRKKKSARQTPGRWVKPGERVDIHGYTITGGFFYFGNRLLAEAKSLRRAGIMEAALVDDQLKVVKDHYVYEDICLDESLSYAEFTPRCRGAYLDWLSRNRDEADVPIEYILLYMSGMERRIFVDAYTDEVDNREYKAIHRELNRLYSIYNGWNYEEVSYMLLEIIATMHLMRPSLNYDQTVVDLAHTRDNIDFHYRLAKLLADGKPIPSDAAYEIIYQFGDFNPRTAAVNCPDEFRLLFDQLYLKRYDGGAIVEPGDDTFSIAYMPINPTLDAKYILNEEQLPSPQFARWPLEEWIELAERATDMLGPYSRQRGNFRIRGERKLRAALFLPDELGDLREGHELESFRNWVQDRIDCDDGWADTHTFWRFVNSTPPRTLAKTDLDLMQKLTDIVDVSLVPDPRYHRDKPAADGIVKFFPGRSDFDQTDAYRFMLVFLRLGAAFITANDGTDEAMMTFLEEAIVQRADLPLAASRSLSAYLSWRMRTPTKAQPTRKWTEGLDPAAKREMKKALLQLAQANGNIHPREIKLLEKFYVAMGFEKIAVARDLHDLSVGQLASASSEVTAGEEAGHSLDDDKVGMHEQQTKEAQALLGTIFQDQEGDARVTTAGPSKAVETTVPQDSLAAAHVELSDRHRQLYERIIAKDQWTLGDMNRLCKEFGLMVAAVIEGINDWSHERVEAPVLLEEGNIIVDRDIVEELRG